MGAWGPGLYQDDVAEEIRDDYKDGLEKEPNEIALTDRIIEQSQFFLNDPDDAPIFWFALADTQWKLGRLEDRVKEKALYYIEEGGDLRRWEEENPKQAPKRAAVLEKLKEELLSPQPEKKKISVPRLYKCEWQIGDVYVYPLDSENAIERGFKGKSLLFHKIGETKWYPGHVVPVVRVKLADSDNLPKTTEAFNRLRYLQVWLQQYKWIFPSKNPSEQEKLLKEYQTLPIFQMVLLNTSKRIIPKKMFYLENFKDVESPTLEWVPEDWAYPSTLWKNFDTYFLNDIRELNSERISEDGTFN